MSAPYYSNTFKNLPIGKLRVILFFAGFLQAFFISYGQSDTLLEKSLVVWVDTENLDQHGGSALTIDDQKGHFDGVVFGEIEASKWMAGSDNFKRTNKSQDEYGEESSTGTGKFVQLAIVYEKSKISIFRNGTLLNSYPIDALQSYPYNNSAVLMGMRHIDVGNPEDSFEGSVYEARIYSYALSEGEIEGLRMGKLTGSNPWALWDFSKGLQEQLGRFNAFELLNGAKIEGNRLILPGGGATFKSYNTSGTAKNWSPSEPVSPEIISNTRAFREKLLSDPYRPAYHFVVPEDRGYPGDPNGAFYHNGRYHLMYLYNRQDVGFSWGHISSTDLVHWRHHPDAIGPGNGDEGCFSGGGFVDDDGTAYLSYWMLWGDKGIGMARSTDKNFDSWEKFESNPVIKSTEWGITEMEVNGNEIHVGSADPSNIWKEGDTYFMLTGNLLVLNKYGRNDDSPEDEKGDRLYLFSSKNLTNWKYERRFYESDRKWTRASEDNMCPSFFPLPSSPDGGKPSDKHLLLFISHNLGCQYYIGSYGDGEFIPEKHGRMTWEDKNYFAPEALMDDKGRQIMWAWIFDDRPGDMRNASGWTGTYGLPRSLWLGTDGTLRIRPVEELKALRYNQQSIENLSVIEGKDVDISSMASELMELEIKVKIEPGSKVGVRLGIDENREEYTEILYDDTEGKLMVDTRKSSLKYRQKIVEKAPFQLREEILTLRIFVDKSIVEVYANDKQAIARRVYPTKGGMGVELFSEGGNAEILSVKTWEISPSNAY